MVFVCFGGGRRQIALRYRHRRCRGRTRPTDFFCLTLLSSIQEGAINEATLNKQLGRRRRRRNKTRGNRKQRLDFLEPTT